MKKAVLFLIFNRPNTTKKVFEAIRNVRPPRLYIAADGPRKDKKNEKEKCEETKKIVENIDWDCEVKTLFRDENLGCGVAVSEAITWFFENEEDGIILEDDCLPHPTFFSYCETLLDYYAHDERIMHIGGDKFLDFEYGDASYYFATIDHCWGWATWAYAWKHFDFNLDKYPLHLIEERLLNFYSDVSMQKYWKDIYIKMINKDESVWDYQWALSIIANDALVINPNKNLVSNIGFDEDGTHTIGGSPWDNLPTYPLENIVHPKYVKRSMFIDEKIMDYLFFGNCKNKRKLTFLEHIFSVYRGAKFVEITILGIKISIRRKKQKN